ncbi:MAG: hypothetical protein IPK31_11405 [Chitinophagaceae bacterium]|nr:hypothetical protein [Chitinophagaceae bacterium]
MKKMFFILASALLIAGAGVAQDQIQQKDKLQKRDRIHQEDHLMLKDGKLYQVKQGVQSQVQAQVTLQNGTVCNPDGTYQLKDRNQLRLRDGECLDMEGNRYMNQNRFNNRKTMSQGQIQRSQNRTMNRTRPSTQGTGNRKGESTDHFSHQFRPKN